MAVAVVVALAFAGSPATTCWLLPQNHDSRLTTHDSRTTIHDTFHHSLVTNKARLHLPHGHLLLTDDDAVSPRPSPRPPSPEILQSHQASSHPCKTCRAIHPKRNAGKITTDILLLHPFPQVLQHNITPSSTSFWDLPHPIFQPGNRGKPSNIFSCSDSTGATWGIHVISWRWTGAWIDQISLSLCHSDAI